MTNHLEMSMNSHRFRSCNAQKRTRPCKAAAFPFLAAREIERKIGSQVVSNSDLNPGTTIAESTVASIALHTYSPQSHSGTATTIVYKRQLTRTRNPTTPPGTRHVRRGIDGAHNLDNLHVCIAAISRRDHRQRVRALEAVPLQAQLAPSPATQMHRCI